MQKIFKYKLKVDDDIQRVDLPIGFKILSLQVQDGQICFWAEVDPASPIQPRRFIMYDTGWEHEFEYRHFEHIGTVQIGPSVWHIYME